MNLITHEKILASIIFAMSSLQLPDRKEDEVDEMEGGRGRGRRGWG